MSRDTLKQRGATIQDKKETISQLIRQSGKKKKKPKTLTSNHILANVRFFFVPANRFPLWTWGHHATGAILVRKIDNTLVWY